MSCVGVVVTTDTLAERTLGAPASGELLRVWEGAVGDTGLYGRGGLRAIFRTGDGAFSCSFPPAFDD